jgi:7-cyano-7-deazaguanine reductase
MPTKPSKQLETFGNPNPERDYLIRIVIPEFTCLCPKTGQPDFAVLHLEYIADLRCVELKSLKQYVWSFRNEGAFHEAVTNAMLSDLVAATDPRFMELRAEFNVRGGIYTTVVASHRKPGWAGTAAVGAKATARPAPHQPAGAAMHGRARAHTTAAARTEQGSDDGDHDRGGTPVRPQPNADALYVGIDLGTSGCRVIAIDAAGVVHGQGDAPLPMPLKNDGQATQDPALWWKAATAALHALFKTVDAGRVRAIAVDGTSASVLLCDAKGAPVTPALMYSDQRAQAQAERIAALGITDTAAHGATGSLAKLLWLQDKGLDKKAARLLHQADWIAGRLSGRFDVSDYNNCLKLGYDAQHGAWPTWFARLQVNTALLPTVLTPGDLIGPVLPEIAQALRLASDTQVIAGTTDGVAAFLAAGGSEPGHGVTSLGSTLVLKLLSDQPIFAAEHGVYSHRLGRHWLVGGASNSGGAVLLQYFMPAQMREMTGELHPDEPTGLHYYPLPGIGERFPVNDPELAPVLEPLPGDSATFFQGMLEGMARIEAEGYALLAQLGAPALREIRTTGGGAENPAWTRIRAHMLGVEMKKARSESAAYGAALLASGRLQQAYA